MHCHIARLPLAPIERQQDVPAPVSQIVMKLLAKTAEEALPDCDQVLRAIFGVVLQEWETPAPGQTEFHAGPTRHAR